MLDTLPEVTGAGGRTDPRVLRSRRAVLDAALHELAGNGYGAFTIESVAARCGVARSTIYRLWPDKLQLISDAVETLNEQPRPDGRPDESARDHVAALVRHLAEVMAESMVSACLPALIDGAERDEAVRSLHHAYNERRRASLVAAISAAIESGEVSHDVDPELAALALAGAIVYRRLMTSEPFNPWETNRLLDAVIGPRPTAMRP